MYHLALLDPPLEPVDGIELGDVLDGCTPAEQRVIIEIATSARQALKKYAI